MTKDYEKECKQTKELFEALRESVRASKRQRVKWLIGQVIYTLALLYMLVMSHYDHLTVEALADVTKMIMQEIVDGTGVVIRGGIPTDANSEDT